MEDRLDKGEKGREPLLTSSFRTRIFLHSLIFPFKEISPSLPSPVSPIKNGVSPLYPSLPDSLVSHSRFPLPSLYPVEGSSVTLDPSIHYAKRYFVMILLPYSSGKRMKP